MLVAPGFKCDPEVDGVNSEAAIMIDYEAHMIVIAGSQYSGEIKKSVFSTSSACPAPARPPCPPTPAAS